MMHKQLPLAAVVVLAIVAFAAWRKNKLNAILPAAMQHREGFRGAFGRTPAMRQCILGGGGDPGIGFNACTWV